MLPRFGPWLALILAAPALAGCLEEPGGGPGVGDGLVPPVETPKLPVDVPPTRLPTETETRLVYEREHVFAGDPEVHRFAVPEGATELLFDARISASVLGQEVSIHLLGPDGKSAAECREDACEARIDAPPPGGWAVGYAGMDQRNASVRVRVVVGPVPVPPTLTPPTSTPPTPPPVADRALLYERRHDFSDTPSTASTDDQLVVHEGFDTLRVSVRWSGGGPGHDASVRVHAPDGSQAHACAPAQDPCEWKGDAPAAGLWRIAYEGSAPYKTEVVVEAFALGRAPTPSNMSVHERRHEYPTAHPWNRTTGFWVPEGYRFLAWSAGFLRQDLGGPGDTPRAYLYDPDGKLRARCEPGPGLSCPPVVDPEPAGLWRVAYLGPATGAVETRAFLHGGPGWKTPPPASPMPQPGETMLLRNQHQAGGDRQLLRVEEGVSRLRFVVENNGTFEGRVDLVGPDNVVWASCLDPCERVLEPRVFGDWWVEYSPGVGGEAGASVYATRR